MLRESWDFIVIGIAYLDVSLAVLVALLLFPLILVGEGAHGIARRVRLCH